VVRLNNVYVEATVKEDIVDTTAEKCNATACNIVLGSMNAAMVVENSFCECNDAVSTVSVCVQYSVIVCRAVVRALRLCVLRRHRQPQLPRRTRHDVSQTIISSGCYPSLNLIDWSAVWVRVKLLTC
jgi:hypothetical protein